MFLANEVQTAMSAACLRSTSIGWNRMANERTVPNADINTPGTEFPNS